MTSERRRGALALVLMAWTVASMGIFARYLNADFALFEQTYLRVALAAVLTAVLFVREITWSKFLSTSYRDMFVLSFRAIALYTGVILMTEAYLTTKYSNPAFIASIPLLPLIGYVLLGEKLRLRTLVYIALGFVGVALMTVQDITTLTFGFGECMALLSAFAFNVSYVGRRWHSDHLNNKESSLVMFVVGALFAVLLSFAWHEPLPQIGQFTPAILGVFIVAAFFNAANLFLTNYGFQRVKVGVAGNILTLESVFALAYSLILYAEVPGLRELLGGVLVIASVIQINRGEDA